MTSLSKITADVSPVIRAKSKKINSKLTEWEMCYPFSIDVKKWNNAFLLSLEIDIAQLENTPADVEKTFSNHFIKSCLLIEQSIKSC